MIASDGIYFGFVYFLAVAAVATSRSAKINSDRPLPFLLQPKLDPEDTDQAVLVIHQHGL